MTNRLPPTLQVRQRRDDDLVGLYALLSQDDFAHHGCASDPFTSIEEFSASSVANGTNQLDIVATVDGTIVGFVGLQRLGGRQDHTASFTLAVHERFQRLGIGSALMTISIVCAVRKLKLERIQSIVFADNARALSLYERLGFAIEGRVSKFVRRDGQFIDGLAIAWLAGRGDSPGMAGPLAEEAGLSPSMP